MKNIRKEIAIYVQLGSFAVIWAAILYFSRTPLAINGDAIRTFPEAVTVYVIVSYIFTKLLWRLPILQGWLVPFPDLEGTWEGTLKSTWRNPTTGDPLPPIPAVMIIRQSFSSVSCTLHTAESDSYSSTARISEDDESGVLRLTYNFTNRPKVTMRDRSTIHDGAAILRIISEPQRALEGEYWTNRRTTGEVSLSFKSRKVVETVL